MSIPTIVNFDTNKIPVEGTAEFRENASYVWSHVPTVINSINSTVKNINSTSQTIEQGVLQVSISKTETLEAKNTAVSAKDEAVLAKNYIQGYVVPTEATYSPTTIESKIDMSETLNLTGAI